MRQKNVRLNDNNQMINCDLFYYFENADEEHKDDQNVVCATSWLSLAANSSFDGKRANKSLMRTPPKIKVEEWPAPLTFANQIPKTSKRMKQHTIWSISWPSLKKKKRFLRIKDREEERGKVTDPIWVMRRGVLSEVWKNGLPFNSSIESRAAFEPVAWGSSIQGKMKPTER